MDEDEGEDSGGMVDSGTTITDSIFCKYKINIVFVARVSRDNLAEIISRHVIICFCIFGSMFPRIKI